jgi:hypothetical protein
MDIGGILTEILLDILPEEIKKSGRGREYFEDKIVLELWPWTKFSNPSTPLKQRFYLMEGEEQMGKERNREQEVIAYGV